MEVVHVIKKGKLMDTLECFHIYKETKADNQINETNGQRKRNIRNYNTSRPLKGALGSIAAEQLEGIRCGKPFTPAGTESYTGTEARSLLQEKIQPATTAKKKKKAVRNETFYNYTRYSAQISTTRHNKSDSAITEIDSSRP